MEIKAKINQIKEKLEKIHQEMNSNENNTSIKERVSNLLVTLRALSSRLLVDNSILDAHIVKASFRIKSENIEFFSKKILE